MGGPESSLCRRSLKEDSTDEHDVTISPKLSGLIEMGLQLTENRNKEKFSILYEVPLACEHDPRLRTIMEKPSSGTYIHYSETY